MTSGGEAMTGSYTIKAACGALRCEPSCRAGETACGGAVHGDLGGGSHCLLRGGGSFETWDFDLAEPARVSVEASPDAPFFASLHCDDPFGSPGCFELVRSSACAGGPCFQTIVSPGSLHLSVAAPAQGGPYDLTVACEPFEPCASCQATEAIACGERIDGRLGPEDCEVLHPSEGSAFRMRTERWVFDVPAAGLFGVRVEAPGEFVTARVIRPGDCSPAHEGFPEPCPSAPAAACSLFTLDAGRHWIEVVQNASGSVVPPLDYSLEVTCVDLGPCEDCLRGTIACGATAGGELGEGDSRGEGGAFLDIFAVEIEPGPPRDVAIAVRSGVFNPRIVLLDRVCGSVSSIDGCDGAPPGPACITTTVGFGGARLFAGITATSAAAAGSYEVEVSCAPFSRCAPRCIRPHETGPNSDYNPIQCAGDPDLR